MAIFEDLDGLESRIEGLEATVGGADTVVASFTQRFNEMQQTMVLTGREVSSLSSSIGGGLRRAFDGLVFDGLRASDALRLVAQSLANASYNAAIRPVQKGIGEAIANGINGLVSNILPFANGASFSQGRVVPFADGGVVSSPTYFPMRGGTGLMGEAGPEAIMPLTRGADGRLGVRADTGRSATNVTVNIQTPDVAGFQRSQSQIAAQLNRALSRGNRNR